jgi:hypothetical protein
MDAVNPFGDLVVVTYPTTYPAHQPTNNEGWFAEVVAEFVSIAVNEDCCKAPRVQFVGLERCSHRDLGLDEGASIVDDTRALLLSELRKASARIPEDDEIRSMWTAMGYSTDLEALSAQVSLTTMDEFVRSAHPMEIEPVRYPCLSEEVREWERWEGSVGRTECLGGS